MVEIKKFLDVASIVALRKTEYFNKVWHKLENQIQSNVDKEEVKKAVIKIIADLDDNLFIGKDERQKNFINSKLTLDKLKLDDKLIWKKTEEKIREL